MSEGLTARKLKNGKIAWLIKYEAGADPVTGRRRTRYKTVRGTKKEAAAARRELLTAVEDGSHVDRSKKTLADFARHWLDTVWRSWSGNPGGWATSANGGGRESSDRHSPWSLCRGLSFPDRALEDLMWLGLSSLTCGVHWWRRPPTLP